MARAIDADRLKQAIDHDYYEHYTKYHDSDQTALIDMVMDDIDEMPTLTPPNEALTLEELRGMRGETVYVVKGKCQWWDIVDFIAGGWLYLRIANKTDLAIDGYSNGWLAYRRKPEV